MISFELLQFLGLLAAFLSLFLVCKKLSINPAIGYLLGGMVLGPSFLDIFKPGPFLETLSHIGILIFLFTVGLEMPFYRLQSLKKYILGMGAIQVFLTTAVLMGVLTLFPWMISSSLVFLGIFTISLSFSSTAIIVQVLSDRFELTTSLGRLSLSILLFQDIIAIFIFVYFDVLDGFFHASTSMLQCVGLSLGGCFVAAGGAYGITWLTKKLFPIYRYSEFILAFIFLAVIGMSLLTEYFHLSLELGAFLMGMVLAGTTWRHQMSVDLHGIRTIFFAIFFIVIGLKINVMACLSIWPWIVGGMIGLFCAKSLVMLFIGVLWRLKRDTLIKLSILISGCSEFLFIIFHQPLMKKYFAPSIIDGCLMMVFLSMITTPVLFSLCNKYLLYLKKKNLHEDKEVPHQKVVISGFGHVGKTVARLLERNFIPFMIIDYDLLRVQAAKTEKYEAICGDIRDIEFLKKIDIQYARVLIITFGHLNASVELVKMLRQKFPALHVCVQVHDYGQANRFAGLGAHLIVPESVDVGIRIASLTLQFLGFSERYSREMTNFPQKPLFGKKPPSALLK